MTDPRRTRMRIPTGEPLCRWCGLVWHEGQHCPLAGVPCVLEEGTPEGPPTTVGCPLAGDACPVCGADTHHVRHRDVTATERSRVRRALDMAPSTHPADRSRGVIDDATAWAVVLMALLVALALWALHGLGGLP